MAVEQAAHVRATRLPIAAVAAYVQEILGQRLAAVAAGVSDAKAVGKWARGERKPHPETERHLRDACQIIELLMQVEDGDTVRAWFRGMNPDLDHEALALARDPLRVLQAARAFAANG